MPSADPVYTLPRHQTAIVAQGPGKIAIQHNAPVPVLAPDMAMVKTRAVAINPADAKMLDYSASPGSIHGYDFSGTIVALGSDVLASGRFQVGDRVAGFVHGMNPMRPDVGAFAEYVGACPDILLRIPDSMGFEEAAGLGVGIGTTVMGLFSELRVPASLEQLQEAAVAHDRKRNKPESFAVGSDLEKGEDEAGKNKGEFVLVAGGSTATGTRAIQLLKLAGLRPIATCSPSHYELALRFGAEKVFDYHSPDCASAIREYTGNQLSYALDCVSMADTTQLCYASLGRAGGRYVSLEPFRQTVATSRALTVEPSWIMALTIFGYRIVLEGEYGREARPKDRAFGARAFAVVQELMDRGLIDTHPVKVMPGGWEGIINGVDLMRAQAASGYKLVYTLP